MIDVRENHPSQTLNDYKLENVKGSESEVERRDAGFKPIMLLENGNTSSTAGSLSTTKASIKNVKNNTIKHSLSNKTAASEGRRGVLQQNMKELIWDGRTGGLDNREDATEKESIRLKGETISKGRDLPPLYFETKSFDRVHSAPDARAQSHLALIDSDSEKMVLSAIAKARKGGKSGRLKPPSKSEKQLLNSPFAHPII